MTLARNSITDIHKDLINNSMFYLSLYCDKMNNFVSILLIAALFMAQEAVAQSTVYATSGMGRTGTGTARLQAQLAVEKDRNNNQQAAIDSNVAGIALNADNITTNQNNIAALTSSLDDSVNALNQMFICAAAGMLYDGADCVFAAGANADPNSFTFTPLDNVDPATVVTSNTVILSGFSGTLTARINSSQTASIVKNSADTGLQEVQVEVGDQIAIKMESSASYQTQVSASFVLGTFATAWTVTTRPDAIVGSFQDVVVDQFSDDGSGYGPTSPKTFSSVAIGTADPGRVVVVALHMRPASTPTAVDVTSVTIGGIAATEAIDVSNIYSARQTYVGIWAAIVPTGTNADITVVWGGGANTKPGTAQTAVITYALYNASGATPHDTASSTSYPLSANIDIPANGFSIAIVGSDHGGSGYASWSGLTEDYDAPLISGNITSAASLASPTAISNLTVNATPSANNHPTMAVASWGP